MELRQIIKAISKAPAYITGEGIRSLLHVLLLLLFLNLVRDFHVTHLVAPIPVAFGASLPSDSDIWTENKNATYTWRFHTAYRDTMSWATSDVHTGSYAVNVTHTYAATYMAFRLTLDQAYDVTNYDGIYFWMKTKSPDSSFGFQMRFHSTNINWDATNEMIMELSTNPAMANNTWTQYFSPFFYFTKKGTASWTSIRQIYFYFTSLGSADNTQLLIDDLHFGHYEIPVMSPAPTTVQQTLMANVWHNFKDSQYTVLYNGRSYTTQYESQTISTNIWTMGALEGEVLGHSIYALSLAYDKSGFTFLKTEAQKLADWLLQGQVQNGVFKGMFLNSYTNSTHSWSNTITVTNNAWMMAGLSYLYGLTSNTTYGIALKLMRDPITGVFWNGSNMNTGANYATEAITYSNGFVPMRDGASLAAFSLYYKYVEQNATVLDRLQKLVTTGITTPSWNRSRCLAPTAWEDNAYYVTGLYWAYKVTSSTDYRGYFVNATENMLAKMIQHPSQNGSAIYSSIGYPLQWRYSKKDTQDNWGLAESLHLFYLVNELDPHSYWINALETSLFKHLYDSQDDDGGHARLAGWNDKQYSGQPMFMYLSLQLYNLAKSSDLYLLGSSGLASNVRILSQTLSFTITDTGTSTTYVYVGERGKPYSLYGTGTWIYDSASKIVRVQQFHLGAATIGLSWRGLGVAHWSRWLQPR